MRNAVRILSTQPALMIDFSLIAPGSEFRSTSSKGRSSKSGNMLVCIARVGGLAQGALLAGTAVAGGVALGAKLLAAKGGAMSVSQAAGMGAGGGAAAGDSGGGGGFGGGGGGGTSGRGAAATPNMGGGGRG